MTGPGAEAREEIVLASASPRRAKILASLGIRFIVVKTGAPERDIPGDPLGTVAANAVAKGAAAARFAQGRRVLSADTVVSLDGRIYGKPADAGEAARFLRELSGRTHSMFTAVALDGEVKTAESLVKFRELSGADIDSYIRRVNPLDRAGAYDIDESGDLLVESFTGEYENIMGLPVSPLAEWGLCAKP